MTITNTRRSPSGFDFFLLLGSLFGIFVIFEATILSSAGSWFDPIAYIVFFALLVPILLFLDIVFWHYCGKEIITVTDTELEIRKTGRIFKRKKRIKLHDIKDIYLWQKKVRDIHIAMAFWDFTMQGKLRIVYGKYGEHYIGINMSDREARELLEDLSEYIPCLRGGGYR